ncbi:MAG TPA: hypothetical protein VFZ91_09240 [Allosphingosinicella sp.]
MTRNRSRTVLAALLILAACYPTPAPETVYSSCNVLGSSDWKAHVEIFPNAAPMPYLRRKLIVTGKVTTAGGGVYVSLGEGPVSRLDQPVQQIVVRTEGSPEAGAAPVTHNVRGVFPAMKRYGGVAIRCGDGIIAEIRDVPIPPRKKGENSLF